ncbi:MAG TPA: SCO family protein [Nocardioides sp.]|uniref:SCO family protein n=1 Tax=Nocardioides sp. TaxID=35761 RepID=UPI002E31AF92|nr:SCO family protein [Nocardioides sp.]HEX3931066.1 SCO family protein [Nocardioides sp.]
MAVLTSCTLTACGAARGAERHSGVGSTEAAAPSYGTTLNGPVPATILDAPLVDQAGRPTSLGSWHGKAIVLSDVMTLCQETCPLATASMVSAAREIDRTPLGKNVEFVSLTIDPARDDLRHLRAYRHQFGALPNWAVLRGSPQVVNAIWDRLGVWRHRTRLRPPYPTDWVTGQHLTTDIAHTDELILIDRDQRFRYEMEGAGNIRPGAIPARIYRFMDALGHRNAARPDVGSWSPSQVKTVIGWMLGRPTS